VAAFVSVQQSDILLLSSSSACDSSNRYELRLSISSREGYNGKFVAKTEILQLMIKGRLSQNTLFFRW